MILCTFEKDLCDWQIISEDEKYKWQRNTEDELISNNIPGPLNGDYHDEKNKYFMIASDFVAGQDSFEGAKTILKSPDFLVEEHPIECFNFWFYFGVSKIHL